MNNVYKLPLRDIKLPNEGMNHLAWLFAALYVSEGWYDNWMLRGKIHSKARAMVLYDRALNGAIHPQCYKD